MKNKRLAITFIAILAFLTLTACGGSQAEEQNFRPKGVASVISDNVDVPDFRAMEATLKEDPASLVVPEALEKVGGPEAFRKEFPSGTTFKVLDNTWQSGGTGGGTVQVNMNKPGEPELQVLAYMMEDVKQRWYLLQTVGVQ